MGADGESEKVEASQANSLRFDSRRMQRISDLKPKQRTSHRGMPQATN